MAVATVQQQGVTGTMMNMAHNINTTSRNSSPKCVYCLSFFVDFTNDYLCVFLLCLDSNTLRACSAMKYDAINVDIFTLSTSELELNFNLNES